MRLESLKPVLWTIASAAVAAGIWRLAVGVSTDRFNDESSGQATRIHQHRLLLQGLLAFIAAYAAGSAAIGLAERNHNRVRLQFAVLIIAACGFFAIFTTHGLDDFGAYED